MSACSQKYNNTNADTPVAMWKLMDACGGAGATSSVSGGQHWTNGTNSNVSQRTSYPYFTESGWGTEIDEWTIYELQKDYKTSNAEKPYAVRAVRTF